MRFREGRGKKLSVIRKSYCSRDILSAWFVCSAVVVVGRFLYREDTLYSNKTYPKVNLLAPAFTQFLLGAEFEW